MSQYSPAKISAADVEDIGLSLTYARRKRVHEWKVMDGETEVSSLSVYRVSAKMDWQIGYVTTETQWRRMGFAHLLYNTAVAQLGTIVHDHNRTSSGNNWAHAVGGQIPEWNRI